MKKVGYIFVGLMLFGTVEAYALEPFQYYRGIRSLGMGGAAVAVVNDETAVAVNPAGLGKLRNFFGTVLDPEVETNGLSQGLLLTGSTGAFSKTDDLAAFLEANPDKYFYSRVQLFPSMVVRNFGLGVLYSQENYGTYDSAAGTMDLVSRQDTSYLVGYSFRFWSGRIKLGFTGKLIQRSIVAETAMDYAANPTPSTLEKSGTGMGVDTGLILTAPWQLLPTLAVTAQDLGGTKFTGSGSDLPAPQEQIVNVGLSISPVHARDLRSQWTMEYRNALDTESTDAQSKLHVGTEFNYSDFLFFRAGMYQRYWTAGSEFSTQFYQIQFATYALNVGTEESPIENRRYAVKFGLRF